MVVAHLVVFIVRCAVVVCTVIAVYRSLPHINEQTLFLYI